jgi:hypothetical protein
MRKNSGFYVTTVGNDLIGGAGSGPHTVRILKHGGRVRLEANGELALAFDDDGEHYGPIWGSGNIGIRFMAYTMSAVVHELRVYELD